MPDAKFDFQDELGLKGPQRDKMYELPIDRKKYLLQQNRQYGSVSRATASKSTRSITQASTFSPASGGAIMPRLVPQLTGDSLMKRFSVVGWGGGSPSSPTPKADFDQPASPEAPSRMTHGRKRRSVDHGVEEVQPLQPQTTGGLWNSWWASSGGDKGGDKAQKETPKWYVDGIRNVRTTDMKLVKHLISLRVHLSTANIVWIEEFVGEEKGIDALGNVLATLVGKGGKRKTLTEVENTVLFELVKCLRVLLNTEARQLFFTTTLAGC